VIVSLHPTLAETLSAHYYVHQIKENSVVLRLGEMYPDGEEILLFVSEIPGTPLIHVSDEGRTLQIYREDLSTVIPKKEYERILRHARLHGVHIDPVMYTIHFEAKRADLVPNIRRMTAFIKNLTYGKYASL